MDKICSVRLCLGLLAVFSIILSIYSADGKPLALQGNPGLLERGDTSPRTCCWLCCSAKASAGGNQRRATWSWQKKLEELEQLEKLKEQLGAEEGSEEAYAEAGLLSPHPAKRACFWKYCV